MLTEGTEIYRRTQRSANEPLDLERATALPTLGRFAFYSVAARSR
jgi:hypothetical protein